MARTDRDRNAAERGIQPAMPRLCPTATEATIRKYDFVLLGATGFTGQLVAEALALAASSGAAGSDGAPARWAIAGRDPRKLEDVKTSLVGISPVNGDVGVIVADTADSASLRALAAQTRVLATTVGPYAAHGLPVVEACVDEGTHYLDITGEPPFVSTSRDRFDARARAAGLRIVHCCGFDSIPADLGALFTVRQLPAATAKQVRCYVKTNGSYSGGTWASMIGMFHDGSVRSAGGSDAAGAESTSAGASGAPRGKRDRGPLVHRPPPGVRGVAIPLPVIDPVLVGRSARALPEVYGPDFTYGHFLVVRSVGRAAQLAAGVGALWGLAKVGPARRALLRRRPSGAGPSADERAKSFFQLTFTGRAGDARVTTRVSGGDPGYTETSRMLAHATLLLARREASLPRAAGVLTPAVAFGDAGIEAMRRAGLTFEVVPEA